MAIFNIGEAKTNFSRLIRSVEAGEEVVITRAGVPVARPVPCKPVKPGRRQCGAM